MGNKTAVQIMRMNIKQKCESIRRICVAIAPEMEKEPVGAIVKIEAKQAN